MNLALAPLAGILSAGNRVMHKPLNLLHQPRIYLSR